MTKYELIEKIETNGDIWYHVRKNGRYVDNSYTQNIEEAKEMLHEFANGGKPSEPIIKTIKTIEVNDDIEDDK